MADEIPNLWVTPQATAEPEPVAQHQQFAAHQAAGPTVPPPVPSRRQLGSVQAPQTQLGTLPMRPAQGVLWWALGVHGGAGVSTLLRTVGGGGDAQRRWPDIHGAVSGVHVVLVARADAHGLAAAQAALQEWHSGQAPASTNVVGLVLMADAPTKPPRSVRDRIRVLTGAVPQSWQVPWVEEWREGGKARKRVKELEILEQTLLQLPPPHITLALPPGPSATERTAGPSVTERIADPAAGHPPGPMPGPAPTPAPAQPVIPHANPGDYYLPQPGTQQPASQPAQQTRPVYQPQPMPQHQPAYQGPPVQQVHQAQPTHQAQQPHQAQPVQPGPAAPPAQPAPAVYVPQPMPPVQPAQQAHPQHPQHPLASAPPARTAPPAADEAVLPPPDPATRLGAWPANHPTSEGKR